MHYRSSRVFSLGGWSPQLPTRFLVSRGTHERIQSLTPFAYGAITLFGSPFQVLSTRGQVGNSVQSLRFLLIRRTTPIWHGISVREAISVWAVPRSLTTTWGIAVAFFSSGYLDVSVPLVRLTHLCIQCVIPSLCWVGFPIQRSPDQRSFATSPKLIAGYHVFHRL